MKVICFFWPLSVTKIVLVCQVWCCQQNILVYLPFLLPLKIFKPSDLIILPKFYILSTEQLAEMIVLMNMPLILVYFLEFSNQGSWAWTPTLENIWVGRLILLHYPHCLSLFFQLKSCTCLLPIDLKVSEPVKMGK